MFMRSIFWLNYLPFHSFAEAGRVYKPYMYCVLVCFYVCVQCLSNIFLSRIFHKRNAKIHIPSEFPCIFKSSRLCVCVRWKWVVLARILLIEMDWDLSFIFSEDAKRQIRQADFQYLYSLNMPNLCIYSSTWIAKTTKTTTTATYIINKKRRWFLIFSVDFVIDEICLNVSYI